MRTSPPKQVIGLPAALPAMLVVLAVAIKLGFVVYLGGRVYPDVLKIINYGALVDSGTFSIRSSMINDKTFVGPMLWWPLYEQAGLRGLLAVNFIAFLGLCGVHYGLGRGRYDAATRTVALVLFAFYVGTHRNIVAGEPDDNVAALLFGIGTLIYLDTRRALAAGLCIGIGFLFKFSAAIFGVGFAAYFVWKRAWRELTAAIVGMGLPFLALNIVDGLASFHSLFASLGIQHGYSTLGDLASRFLSTGLAPMVAIATCVWWRYRDDVHTLYWLLSVAYPFYALANRDAFAATFVMMPCLLCGAFLLAEALLGSAELLPCRWRRPVVVGTLIAYIALTTAVTHLHLFRDTTPIVMVHSDAEIRGMFPYNYELP